MRQVYYVRYYGDEHLRLITRGFREERCLVADGEILVKMVL